MSAKNQTYNLHRFIDQVRELLEHEGIDPEMVSYAEVSGGALQMLRGMGVTGVLDQTNTADRGWPSKREETDSPW